MTPEQRRTFDEVAYYMKSMAQGDHEDRAKLRTRVIAQYVSDHVTGSGKSQEEMTAEINELCGDLL